MTMRRRPTSFRRRWWQPQLRGRGRPDGIGIGGERGERGYYSWCAVCVCFWSNLLFSCCSYCDAFVVLHVVPAETRPVLPHSPPKPCTASSSLTARGAVSPENNDEDDEKQQQPEPTWTSDFDGFTVGDDGGGWTSGFESFTAGDTDTKKKNVEDTTARQKNKNKTKSKNDETRNDLEELVYDDDDEDGTASTGTSLSEFLSNGGSATNQKQNKDLTAVRTRLFSLGEDLMIQDYVGTLGFEEVTDWQYYYQDVDEDGNPANDKSKVRTFLNEEVLCCACAWLFRAIVFLLSNALTKGFPAKIQPREPVTTTQDPTEYIMACLTGFPVDPPRHTMIFQFTCRVRRKPIIVS